MWDRIRFYTNAQIKHVDNNIKNPNLYIETNNVSIYDSDKKCFVKVKKIIRNVSNEWNKVYFSSGRVLDCTPGVCEVIPAIHYQLIEEEYLLKI